MMSDRFYVGLAATHHDPAVAVLSAEGDVLFAEATERHLQSKRAINAVPDDVVRIPRLLRELCGDTELVVGVSWPRGYARFLHAFHFVGRAMERDDGTGFLARKLGYAWPWPTLGNGMLAMANQIQQAGNNILGSPLLTNRVRRRSFDHHASHAAAATYASPGVDAVCAVVDGFGVFGTTACFSYSDGRLRRLDRPLAHLGEGSLGQFYAIVCGLCGFDPIQGEEWKVMGLAPYGRLDSRIYELLSKLLAVDGLIVKQRLYGRDYYTWLESLQQLRRPDDAPILASADLAHTGQHVFAELITRFLRNLRNATGSHHLVFTGGCALNSAYNGELLDRTGFERVFIPSAPADDGNALGAAVLARTAEQGPIPARAAPLTPYLGTEVSKEGLARAAAFAKVMLTRIPSGETQERAAEILAAGGLVGWMQGRAEFGPRALGNRSILADPRKPEMKSLLNEHVKFREEFRPFAPAILDEYGHEYFENYQSTPYMERALRFREAVRQRVPAVVHVDGTGRAQSVTRQENPSFHLLITRFYERTGVPLLLNTSFNVMGKPIVHSVEDALSVFNTSGLDALFIDDHMFAKSP